MWITNKASYSLTISFPYSPTLVLTVFLYLNFEKVAVRWILVYGDDVFFVLKKKCIIQNFRPLPFSHCTNFVDWISTLVNAGC